mmetsp:Transcript_158937/g.509860  ORF Transcript_158937/g.509860 Transcript_158937/m.509860 type:complete len:186 (+) Transcript_158937:1790-2347(+)
MQWKKRHTLLKWGSAATGANAAILCATGTGTSKPSMLTVLGKLLWGCAGDAFGAAAALLTLTPAGEEGADGTATGEAGSSACAGRKFAARARPDGTTTPPVRSFLSGLGGRVVPEAREVPVDGDASNDDTEPCAAGLRQALGCAAARLAAELARLLAPMSVEATRRGCSRGLPGASFGPRPRPPA